MADQTVGELIRAQDIGPTDLFVLEQSGVAKSLTGQILINWMTRYADGHGGIQKIEKTRTQGLVDTYRITMADTTTFEFPVTNGRSITSITKTGTSGLADTYTISYNSGAPTTFTVTNGAKGDKGDNVYLWIKYASQKPSEGSHSIGDVPDNWIGVYAGTKSSAPSVWSEYKWFQWKGNQGNPGTPATLVSSKAEYQLSGNGTAPPSGYWSTSIPVVPQGSFLWTRTTQQYNTGTPVVSYSVSRFGIDGKGSVSTVCQKSPTPDGNVEISAADVDALPVTGGAMQGEIDMRSYSLTGLGDASRDGDAVSLRFANGHYATVGHVISTITVSTDNEIDQAIRQIINEQSFAEHSIRFYYLKCTTTSLALGGGCWLLELNKMSVNYGTVVARSYVGSDGVREMKRVWSGAVLQPWEWDNPPMSAGVEYRTTQRYLDKPVYTKLVNLGTLPGIAGGKRINHGAATSQIIRVTGASSDGHAIPYRYGPESPMIWIGATETQVVVITANRSDADYSKLTGTAQIWYTK